MAMSKIISRVIKTKHLVNSIPVQKQHAKSISSSILFKRLVPKDGQKENVLSFLKYPISDNIEAVKNIALPCFNNSLNLEIHGHSHGIVCLSDSDGDIWLCNPATRVFRKLPPSILLINDHDTIITETSAEGFAYVPASNDFKVVRVVNFTEEGSNSVADTVQFCVEVYDLSTDRWRRNEISVPPFGVVWTPSFEICHKCIYYWWGFENNILSFDMTQELFRPISMPKGLVLYGNERSLLVWNGSIVLFDYPFREDDERIFDIWLMVMDGSVEWVKLMTIGPLSGIVRPLLFVNSDQELFMEAKDGQVVSYNLITKEIKNLPIKGIPEKLQCFVFEKSSLSVSKGWKTVA